MTRTNRPAPDPDDDRPPGAIGEVTCAVCGCPGWLMDANQRGFRIAHPGRLFCCRAPR